MEEAVAPTLEEWNKQTAVEISTVEMDSMLSEYCEARIKYEELEEELKKLGKIWDEKEAIILNALDVTKKSKYFVDNLGTVNVIVEMSVQTPKTLSDKRALAMYILNKYGSEVRDNLHSVNSKSLNSFYNQEMDLAFKEGNANFKMPGVGLPSSRKKLRFTAIKQKES